VSLVAKRLAVTVAIVLPIAFLVSRDHWRRDDSVRESLHVCEVERDVRAAEVQQWRGKAWRTLGLVQSLSDDRLLLSRNLNRCVLQEDPCRRR
jgi:hypothetical protein